MQKEYLPHEKPEPTINKPESSNGDQEEKNFNKLSSFAREFYSYDIPEMPRVARAKQRMEYLTSSQWAVMEEELRGKIKAGGGGSMVDKVLAWRKKRGDFDYDDDDDDEEQEAFLGDVEVPILTSDMKGVNENTLKLGFLKSDLQLECLLRNIPYEGCDAKPLLISKILYYKDTLFLNTNTFQILEGQCSS